LVYGGLSTVLMYFPSQILASPEAQRTLGSGKYFDRRLNPTPLGKWASDSKNRQALWEKMAEIIGEK
jgi:hypothetical protein